MSEYHYVYWLSYVYYVITALLLMGEIDLVNEILLFQTSLSESEEEKEKEPTFIVTMDGIDSKYFKEKQAVSFL